MSDNKFFESAKDFLKNGKTEKPNLESAKKVSRSLFASASDKAKALKKGMSEKTDKAAAKVAHVYNDWTGREVSKEDVKKVTAVSATIGSVLAAGPVAGMAVRQARLNQMRAQQMAEGQDSDVAAGDNAEAAGVDNQSFDAQVDASGIPTPNVPPSDPSAEWEQDDIEYDQQQYDQLQEHYEHQERLDDVIDDQVNYNDSLDCGFDSFGEC